MSQRTLSAITKKVMMALAGLFLILFLPVHLGINLFLLPITDNHKDIFLQAAEFMSTFPPMKIMEVVLFGGFILHIVYGVIVQLQNWASRGKERYASGSKTKVGIASKTMIYSGILIFLFLAMHMYQFYFVKLGFVDGPMHDGHPDFFTIAVELFSHDLVFSLLYIATFIVLIFHLLHAFQSAFQTMGWSHPTYTPFIKAVGKVYAIVIPIGFIIIPLYYMINPVS